MIESHRRSAVSFNSPLTLSIYPADVLAQAAATQPQIIAEPQPGPVQPDALETTAERTFAISPRLGPIGEHSPEVRDVPFKSRDTAPSRHDIPVVIEDPLDKLLPKDEELKGIAVKSAGTHPRRRSTDPQTAASASNAAQPAGYDAPPEAVPAVQPDEQTAEAEPAAFFAHDDLDESTAYAVDDDPSPPNPTPAPSADSQTLKPNTGSPGFPSLSGSPPPKRRQL